MRHGETDYNRNNILQGHINTHLNETGKKQAYRVAKYIKRNNLKFDKIYVSPLDRAQETAEIVSGRNRNDFIIDDRLIEIDYGENIDGKCIAELDKETVSFLNDPLNVLPPKGVEDISHLMERVYSFIREIIKTNEDEQILIVTHGETIRAFFACVEGLEYFIEDIWKMPINNCDLFYIRYKNKNFPYYCPDGGAIMEVCELS